MGSSDAGDLDFGGIKISCGSHPAGIPQPFWNQRELNSGVCNFSDEAAVAVQHVVQRLVVVFGQEAMPGRFEAEAVVDSAQAIHIGQSLDQPQHVLVGTAAPNCFVQFTRIARYLR